MFQSILKTLKNKRGFTLIELIIVIAIIGVMGVLAKADFGTLNDSGKSVGQESELDAIRMGLDMYNAKNSYYPSSLTTLVSDGYMKKLRLSGGATVVDKWGTALTYNTSTGEVCSAGPDKVAGNTDDICR